MTDRRTYQRRVEHLLAQIEDETHDLRLLKVAGVRAAALAERKLELAQVRAELASLVASV
jgi:hypothetical protein